MKLLPRPEPASAWREILLSLALLAAAAAFGALHLQGGALAAPLAYGLAGPLSLISWILVVRFVLMAGWGRRVWSVVLLGMLALVLFAGTGGVVAACVVSGLFLTPRQYRSWRRIPDRRRAVAFGLGLPAIVLAVMLLRFASAPPAPGFVAACRGLVIWSAVSLALFWAWSLFHLAIRMRLHFLRLRPKLAVSAVLIGLVPLILVVVLGLTVLYTGLGGARGARLSAILEEWRVLADEGADMAGALYDTTFVWPEPAAAPTPPRIAAPDWAPEMARLLPVRLGRDVADTTAWFAADEKLWLMRWRGLDGEQPSVTAWQLGHRPLTRLSALLRAGINIDGRGGVVVMDADDAEDAETLRIAADSPSEALARAEAAGDSSQAEGFPGVQVSYRSTDGGDGFWSRWVYFGGAVLQVFELLDDRVATNSYFAQLLVGPSDLRAEFLEGESNVNIVVVIGLGIVAFLFLVIEVFALFFGVRISEGIVTGVHALHRGTQAVAKGDLDTVITIPNEDEFGDLARSFNEMTTAVKHGREIALANERLVQELATARSIQMRLLPAGEPMVRDFEVTGASIPSREIGGDYYDFLAQGEDRIGIAIGDVSGKGMPAALLMSNLQASLHGQVLHPGTVAGVVERVNELLVKATEPHMFATFFYGLLEADTGRFTCTNAGHNPPLWLRADGSIAELTTGGLLLGMVGQQVYQQDTVVMEPGDVIVMYTDGITEAVGPSAEEDDPEAMFGEAQLHQVLRANRHLPASGIKDAILAAVAAHTHGVPQSDDITLVVIRRQG